ncbi:hypothetical protein SISSUDRAFT_1122182 [Sistotremastrum suecicum HHB10207 ss-3]|uniref:Zn(2)-C6 fungal-type domain-containing protein n=1 Tax=Sistotremastrum suecicum HHB10207 ss-3 TaxID=1314776 RepID=A0A165ZQU8_9AGAM|nr:hypothetical protein SISSUDRAFT_1122182 [Sistotremastrum suecicum HHB10207 ss-3]
MMILSPIYHGQRQDYHPPPGPPPFQFPLLPSPPGSPTRLAQLDPDLADSIPYPLLSNRLSLRSQSSLSSPATPPHLEPSSLPPAVAEDDPEQPWNLVPYHVPWGSSYVGYSSGTLPGPEGGKSIFLRSPTPTKNQRTSQACEKCRERKAKCSGSRPACGRCIARGHVCEYGPEIKKVAAPHGGRTISTSSVPSPASSDHSEPKRQRSNTTSSASTYNSSQDEFEFQPKHQARARGVIGEMAHGEMKPSLEFLNAPVVVATSNPSTPKRPTTRSCASVPNFSLLNKSPTSAGGRVGRKRTATESYGYGFGYSATGRGAEGGRGKVNGGDFVAKCQAADAAAVAAGMAVQTSMTPIKIPVPLSLPQLTLASAEPVEAPCLTAKNIPTPAPPAPPTGDTPWSTHGHAQVISPPRLYRLDIPAMPSVDHHNHNHSHSQPQSLSTPISPEIDMDFAFTSGEERDVHTHTLPSQDGVFGSEQPPSTLDSSLYRFSLNADGVGVGVDHESDRNNSQFHGLRYSMSMPHLGGYTISNSGEGNGHGMEGGGMDGTGDVRLEMDMESDSRGVGVGVGIGGVGIGEFATSYDQAGLFLSPGYGSDSQSTPTSYSYSPTTSTSPITAFEHHISPPSSLPYMPSPPSQHHLDSQGHTSLLFAPRASMAYNSSVHTPTDSIADPLANWNISEDMCQDEASLLRGCFNPNDGIQSHHAHSADGRGMRGFDEDIVVLSI